MILLRKIPLIESGKVWNGKFKEFISPEKKLSVRINNRGYATVRIAGKTKMIHRLVAEYYCRNSNPVANTQVNHLDGNKLNNHYSNLEWCTQQENLKHARDAGLWIQPKGYKISYKSQKTKEISLNNLKDNTKLLPIQVKFARKMVVKKKKGSPYTITALAKRFGVSISTLSDAISGKTFSHIK